MRGVDLEVASRRRRRRPGGLAPLRPTPPRRRLPGIRVGILAGLIVLVVIAYVAFALLRSLPGVTVTPVRKTVVFAGRGPRLVWPSQGQAALMLEGVGMIGSHGSQRPTPIASVAKVMT